MRVLLSGGEKTENIVDSINQRFNTSGDEFIVVKYLEDILDNIEEIKNRLRNATLC